MCTSPRTLVSVLLIVGLAILMLTAGCSKQQPQPATQSAAEQPAPAPQQQAAPAPPAPAPDAQPMPAGSARTAKPRPTQPARRPAAGPAGAEGTAPAPDQTEAAQQQRPAPPVPLTYTVPADTPIEVRLQDTISSANATAGQQFGAVLASPIVVDGRTIAAKGANAWGTVVRATPSGRLQTPAELTVRLDAIEVRGRRVPVSTEALGQKADSHQKRNAVGIGGGAALGAIIGGIAGGGKGAAIGAAAGAGAGTAGAAVTGKKDITYTVETPLTFRLTSPLTVR